MVAENMAVAWIVRWKLWEWVLFRRMPWIARWKLWERVLNLFRHKFRRI